MASITLEVGGLIGVREVADAVALPKLEFYIARRGGPVDGTNQEKINWIVNDLVRHVDMTAGEKEISEALRLERARILAEQKDRSWAEEEFEPDDSEILSEF